MLGHPWCKALWDFLADFCFRSSHSARVPPVQSNLEPSHFQWPYLHSPGQDTLAYTQSSLSPGTQGPAATLALAVLPGYPMHRVPQDLLGYAVLQLQPPLQGTFYTSVFPGVPGISQFTSTSASVILSRYPLCIEPWVFLDACTIVSAVLLGYPLLREPRDLLAHTNHSSSCPPRAFSVCTTLGHSGLYPL